MEAILFDILYFHRSLNLFPVELQKSRGSQRLYSSTAGSEEAQASSLASWSTECKGYSPATFFICSGLEFCIARR